jgi:cytoskeletal protein RodZ
MFARFIHKKSTKIGLQEQRQEKLAEIGSKLSQIRTEKEISLKAIETKTQIPIRLLAAIEAGDMSLLPEPVYIRGLIVRFADALGLNGKEIADTFPTELAVKRRSPLLQLPAPSLQLRPFHLYLLYILLVILAVRGISNILKQSQSQVAIEPRSQSASQPASNTKSSATKPVSAPKKTRTKPVEVDVKISDPCWLDIIVDGKRVFQGTLAKGTQQTWSADRQITVRAGNAGGISVKFNEEQPKVLGQLGQVETMTYQAKPSTVSSNQ